MGLLVGGVLLGPFIVLAALFQPISSHANLITNGDFELSVPSNGTGNSWTSTHIDLGGGWRTHYEGNPDENFILNEAGDFFTDPTISQAVSGLIVGEIYRIQGDVACGNICGTGVEPSFRVTRDGAQLFFMPPL